MNIKAILKRKAARLAAGIAGALVLGTMAGYGTCLAASADAADTVVYGKIYTSDANHDYAQALAVKDGKYIYVGDEAGVAKYIDAARTNVIDRRHQGLVMAGATEGHGHYMLASTMEAINAIMPADTPEEIVDCLKQRVRDYPDQKLYLTYGWDNMKLKDIKADLDMRAALDAVCSDKIVVMVDNTGHNCFLNSKAIEAAGMTTDTEVEGGFIAKNKEGRLLGLASDIAMNYAFANIATKQEFFTSEDIAAAVRLAENRLHANGYTSYFDASTSLLGEASYKGISQYDATTGLTVNVGATRKIDPFENIDAGVKEAVDFKAKYTTKHFNPSSIKLFGDGECVESMSGWVLTPYKDGSTGVQVWDTDTFDSLVKKANENGISVHVHASGDAAVQQAVEAFIKAEPVAKAGVLNAVGHSRQITNEVKDLMAKHNIYSATNIGWRIIPEYILDSVNENFDYDFYMAGYPMKSLLDRGIVMTSSTDYPANSGAPCDVPNLIEIAVNGTVDASRQPGAKLKSLDKAECITVEQALDVFTINGAKQMGLQNERGSIEKGKYADFIFLARDITTIPKDEIHTATVEKVYFEGKEVYSK